MTSLSIPVTPFQGDPDLPQAVDVVVIGGGIIGVTTALELAERGVSVALCEKGVIAGEQSSRNWGWTRQMGRDERELPLCIRSVALWAELNARINRETGWRRTGISYLSYNQRDLKGWLTWEEIGKRHNLDARMLSKAEIAEKLPGNRGDILGALHTASDGRAEPWIAVPAMAEYAREKGAKILTGCAVRTVETSGGGVSAVVTERGVIRCQAVVLAGGIWSRLFAGNMGFDFPQLKVIGPVTQVDNVAGVTDMPIGAGDFAYRQRLDGSFTIAVRNKNLAPITPDHIRLMADFVPTYLTTWRELSVQLNGTFLQELMTKRRWSGQDRTPFEECRVMDPKPYPDFTRKALRNITRHFPAFAEARVLREWAGVIDATPDAIPVISPFHPVPGFYLASGFSGHGFGIGPAAGELMADLITGSQTKVDASVFDIGRLRPKYAAKG
ncbi:MULTISPECIES: FAD-binding oxidoreductase [unclassified Chelatococcus]|uniref:NAD(P)/FAD-dependent oxidoreductase n=1 Tax=unclassified Chelatococcus TaxID=2638111 RepID=UPI001BCFB0F9|nr:MULTISPECIES: FAD-binding oxidoreductase [unclassified Chelatococcus]MBS7699909.1 FAD-binding oxidoreductase [Chelatococcus sp. YT9]MBX3558745.1 FAD-binding oxidoreductase [Chelatococcus sp.]